MTSIPFSISPFSASVYLFSCRPLPYIVLEGNNMVNRPGLAVLHNQLNMYPADSLLECGATCFGYQCFGGTRCLHFLASISRWRWQVPANTSTKP